MDFLVKRVNKLTWYYSQKEMTEQVNKLRQENNLDSCTENFVNTKIEYIKTNKLFSKIDNSAGSYYCPKEKKQAITFDVKTEYLELIDFQMQGILNFIVQQMGRGQPVTYNDMVNHVNYLENYYNSRQFVEKLEEKYPEKIKASIQKPKKI